MARPRYQEIKPKVRDNKTGPVWWFEYVEYVKQSDGSEKPTHRSQVIEPCETCSEAKAKRYIDQFLKKLDAKRAPLEWTVSRFVQEVWFPTKARGWEANTRKQMLYLLDKHVLPEFGKRPIAEVKKFQVEAFFNRLADAGYSKGTGKPLLWLIRSIFEDAAENDLCGKNPARKVKLPRDMKPREETEALTPEQTAAIFSSITGEDALLLRVMILCGLRPGELAALRRGDLQDDRLMVDESTDGGHRYKGTKTGNVVPKPIPPDIHRDLMSHLNMTPGGARDPIFRSSLGTMWTVEGLAHRLQPSVRELKGLEGFTLRQCRATYATHLKGDIADVRDLVGHATEQTTLDHYRKPIPERQKRAVADLERRLTQRKRGKLVEIRKKTA